MISVNIKSEYSQDCQVFAMYYIKVCKLWFIVCYLPEAILTSLHFLLVAMHNRI